MITSVKLFTTSIMSYGLYVCVCVCVCVVKTLKIYSLSNFQGYNTMLLTRVTTCTPVLKAVLLKRKHTYASPGEDSVSCISLGSASSDSTSHEDAELTHQRPTVHSTLLYQGLEHPRILVSAEVLESILWTLGNNCSRA